MIHKRFVNYRPENTFNRANWQLVYCTRYLQHLPYHVQRQKLLIGIKRNFFIVLSKINYNFLMTYIPISEELKLRWNVQCGKQLLCYYVAVGQVILATLFNNSYQVQQQLQFTDRICFSIWQVDQRVIASNFDSPASQILPKCI